MREKTERLSTTLAVVAMLLAGALLPSCSGPGPGAGQDASLGDDAGDSGSGDPDGSAPDGDRSDGGAPDGGAPDGDSPDGDSPDADGPGERIEERDIVYSDPGIGDTSYTSLDVYRMSGKSDAQALVFVHGGGWVSGDKENVAMSPGLVDHFLDRGYALVAINYRLQRHAATPGTTYVEQTTDVASAIGWVVDNAESLGVDPTRIVLMGYSSGAHLVALVTTDRAYLAAVDMEPADVAAVVPMDVSAYDIPRAVAEACSQGYCPAAENLPALFGEGLAEQEAASPIHHIVSGEAYPPMMVISALTQPGGVEQTLSASQSDYLVEALSAVGGLAEHYHGADESHTTLVSDFGDSEDEVTRRVSGFLDAVVP